MIKRKCIICGGELHHLLDIENMPGSAQNIPTKEQIEFDKPFTLSLCQCKVCGLNQIDTEPVPYYKDVIRAGGGTKTMRNLRHEEYERLLSFMNKKEFTSCNIIEVGCGRGEFIHMWDDLYDLKGFVPHIFGIENNAELVDSANEEGMTVVKCFAENGTIIPGGPFDAFVQFNFLEHQPNPVDMINTIYLNLKVGGLGLVTVPSFEYILKYDGYYELIRDHIAYYDVRILKELFESCKFKVLEERIVNRDTIEIIVEKMSDLDFHGFSFDGKYTDIGSLQRNYIALKNDFKIYAQELKKTGKKLAIWGASHQGFTLASTTEMLGVIEYIIDSAQFKQGKCAPVSHISIVSPDFYYQNPVDEILIVAPGYTDEIADTIRMKFGNVHISVLKSEKIMEYHK